MRDPERRLSASSDADAIERELLAHLRDAKAPADAKAAAWQGIAAGLATAAPASAAGSAAGTKVAASAGVKLTTLGVTAKVVLATALTAAAVGGAYLIAPQRGPERMKTVQTPRASLPMRAAPQPPPAPVPAPAPAPPEPIAAAPAPRAIKSKSRNAALAEESALLSSARADLRNGDIGSAGATLEQLRKRFPRGALLQEREVLDIDVLLARGEHDAALRSARAFVQRYPNSPHSTRLRALLDGP
jgi:hypothetical protein